MRKTYFSLFFSLLVSLTSWAVPADDSVFNHTQKDGTVLILRLVGDEYLHYYVNTLTGDKMQLGDDGDFYVLDAETVAENAQRAGMRRSVANTNRLSRMRQARKVGTFNNMTGAKKGVVILVNFKDVTMTTGTKAEFSDMFNKQGYNSDGHIGSVADYFKAQSYNQFNLSFDVVGPVKLSNDMAYYGGNRNNSSGNDQHPADMAKEACQLVDDQVNFADYDWDGDGEVDQVFVVYAGYGENYSGADPNTIWPHEWNFSSAGIGALEVDGVKVNTYACCAELSGTSGSILNGMGTACHEFSHCLGYPDTYDTDYSGGVGMRYYDVMCSGSYNGPNRHGEVPVGFTAYERWMAGWLTPIELMSATSVSDMEDLGSTAKAYIIKNGNNENEYFLLENRQISGWFSYFANASAGHGLFITHIDYDATVWGNNRPNDDPNHQRICWVPADKSYDNVMRADFFPGTSNVTTFVPCVWESAGGKWFTKEGGSDFSLIHLANISESSDGKIGFDVRCGYTVKFDAGAGSCTIPSWTQSTTAESTNLPDATINSTEWTFAGWSTSPVEETTTAPDGLLEAGDSYTPTANTTLYAVYKKATEATKWHKLSVSQLTESGTYAMITPNGKALKTAALSDGTALLTQGAFDFDSNGYAVSAPSGTCELTLTKSANGYTIYGKPTGYGYYLYVTGTSLSWKGTKTSYWVVDGEDLRYEKTSGYILLYYNATSTEYFKAYSSKGSLPVSSVLFAQKVTVMESTYATNPAAKYTAASVSLKAKTDAANYYATFSNEAVTFIPLADIDNTQSIEVQTVSVQSGGSLKMKTLATSTATINGEEVTGYYVPANTGVLLHLTLSSGVNTTVTYYTVENVPVGTLTDNMLKPGTGETIPAKANCYYYRLAYDNYSAGTGLGFWYGATDGGAFTCKAGTAYLEVEKTLIDGAQAPARGMIFGQDVEDAEDDEETSIETLMAPVHTTIYDMSGRRVTSPKHGLYIVNGRKVLFR